MQRVKFVMKGGKVLRDELTTPARRGGSSDPPSTR